MARRDSAADLNVVTDLNSGVDLDSVSSPVLLLQLNAFPHAAPSRLHLFTQCPVLSDQHPLQHVQHVFTVPSVPSVTVCGLLLPNSQDTSCGDGVRIQPLPNWSLFDFVSLKFLFGKDSLDH